MKNLLKLGQALSKTEQKQVTGGALGRKPCPCTSNFTDLGNGSCTYPALFPNGFVCSGTIQNGQCCVNS